MFCLHFKLLNLLDYWIRMQIQAYVFNTSFVLFPSNSLFPLQTESRQRFTNLMQFLLGIPATYACCMHNEFTGSTGVQGVYKKTHFSTVYGLLTLLPHQYNHNSLLHPHPACTCLYMNSKDMTLLVIKRH